MRKTEPPMYFACPTRLTTTRLLPGLPTCHFPMLFASTRGRYALTMRRSSDSYSGTFYSVTFNSSSSTAPLLKRVLTAYRAALKMSDAPSAATCARIIEDRNLLDFYQYLVLTAPSIMTRP